MNYSCGQPVSIRFIDLHRDCTEFAVNIFQYIFPILSLLVTIMNVFIIIVFIKPHMRSHTTFILTLIACVDILNIACPAMVFGYLYLRGNYKEYLTSGQIKWSYILGKLCVDMLNMCSLWLTVLLAFIRCRCINSPYVTRQVHSFRKIIIYVIAIIVLVGVVHVPSLSIFEFTTVTTADNITNLTKEVGALVEAEGLFLKSCSGRKLHIFIESITDSLLPCTILMCCNIKILIKLRMAKQSRSSLRNGTVRCSSEDENSQNEINVDSESRKAMNHNSANTNEGTGDVFHDNESLTLHKSKQYQGDKCKPILLKSIEKNGNIKYYASKCTKLHNICTFHAKPVRTSSGSNDRTLDKLDKESRRTSWLIFLVSTIVCVHEIPLAVINTYNLANYADKPLPLSRGCFSIILLLWQFITYPAIFLIYAFMSKAFRKELWKVFTCLCRRNKCNKRKELNTFQRCNKLQRCNKCSDCKKLKRQKSFLCPCSVHKISRSNEPVSGPSHGKDPIDVIESDKANS